MGVRTARRASLGGIVALIVLLAWAEPASPASTEAIVETRRSDPGRDLRPPIMWKPIPFPDLRMDQTAAYSRRHAGSGTWRLEDPVAIVEHVSGGTSMEAAWRTFAANARELGEKPGTCVHFIVDRDGTIHQLVDLDVRCRLTVGLDHTAIGIEHVGRGAQAVLRNPAMMRSSLRLTLWLMATYRIEVRDVIGHAESLDSPYHRERYASWRCLTGSDLGRRDMRPYRERLRDLARANAVPVGPSPDWADSGC